MKTRFNNRLLNVSCRAYWLSISVLTSSQAFAGSEIYPGEYTVLPAGMQVTSFFYYHRNFDGYYVNGDKAYSGKLLGQAIVASYTRYGQTLGMPSSWTVLMPYIHADTDSTNFPAGFGERATGLSDLRLDYNFWPINNPAAGYSLGIGSHFILPTGKYDHKQALNPGDNRCIATFQFGWIQYFSQNLILDVTPEIKLYGDNDDYVGYKMKQSPNYAVTSYLRWKFAPQWEGFVGYQANTGGNQTIAGFDQHNEIRQQRPFVGINKTLTPQSLLMVRYSQDASVDNDVKISNDIVLKLNYFF